MDSQSTKLDQRKESQVKRIQAELMQVKLIQAKYVDRTNYVKERQTKSSLTEKRHCKTASQLLKAISMKTTLHLLSYSQII
jgi:hypothetical protein